MKSKINSLVSDINYTLGKDILDCYELGISWCLKEYTDTREPKINIFSSDVECYRYIQSLKKLLVKKENLADDSEKNNGRVFEIWHLGEYLGLYRDSSFIGACRKALRDRGMSEVDIEKEITLGESRLFSTKIRSDYRG